MIKPTIHITSQTNVKYRFLQSLEKSKQRRQLNQTAVEGLKEIEIALESGVEFAMVYYVEELADWELLQRIHETFPRIDFLSLSRELFEKTTYRGSSGGIISIVHTRELKLEHIKLKKNALVLILEGIEKPGNVGAIFRTADAAAVDAIICVDFPGDLYNPNTIRASLGTVFSLQIAVAEGADARQWIMENGLKTFCSNLHQAKNYTEFDYTAGTALVMGTEATGVSKAWADFAMQNIKIPMLGKIDSMNVSVATAVLVFEAKRQRAIQMKN